MTNNKKNNTTIRHRRTKQALQENIMSTLERLIRERGFEAISLRGFCAEANIDSGIFYRHFESMDDLYNQYAKRTDYWLSNNITIDNLADSEGKELMLDMATSLHRDICENLIMQKILIWGLYTDSQAPKDISQQREVDYAQMIKFYESVFEGSGININVFFSVLIASIYYITLHSEKQISTLVGIDFSQADMKAELDKMIALLIDCIYRKKERDKNISTLMQKMSDNGVSKEDMDDYLSIIDKL